MASTRLLQPRLFIGLFSAGVLMISVLGGCKGASEPATDDKNVSAPVKAGGSTASVDGAALFAQSCAGCHGDKGVGGKRAPILAGKKTPMDETVEVVTNGKGKRMPAFKEKLKEDQIKAIATYVATL